MMHILLLLYIIELKYIPYTVSINIFPYSYSLLCSGPSCTVLCQIVVGYNKILSMSIQYGMYTVCICESSLCHRLVSNVITSGFTLIFLH